MVRSYILIGSVIACIGAYFYGVEVTDTKWVAKTQTAINDAVASARAEEKIKQGKVNDILQKQINGLGDINTQLNADLISLRNRPSRRDSTGDPKVNCKGASGRELSGPDAEFLTREAARADEIREALTACYGYADSIQ
jgi:hypothetical protein